MISRRFNGLAGFLKNYLCVFIAALFILSCGEKKEIATDYSVESRTGIILNDRSSIRLDPILYSTVITYARLGDRVKVIDQSKEKSWIGNTENYWYKVKISGGLVGWTYGNNIKIFTESEEDEINSFLRRFWKRQRAKLREKLKGRWWSVDKYDHFTNQCLELYSDGTYKAYCVDCAPIEGDYDINFIDYELIFSKGTSFGNRLNYKLRGASYILKKEGKEELKFRRVRRKIENVDSEEESDNEKPDTP